VDVSTKQIVRIEGRVVEKDGSKKLSKLMTGLYFPRFLKASMPFVVTRHVGQTEIPIIDFGYNSMPIIVITG
jgi:hypothetical protein